MRVASSIVLAVWLLCTPVRADDLHARFTVEELRSLLAADGYGSPTIENGTNILFRSSGTKLVLIVAADGSLELYCGFKPVRINPEKINQWNRVMRYTRMFASGDGVAIVSDFMMSKGATQTQVQEFIKLFANFSVARFQLFVADNRLDKSAPAPAPAKPPEPGSPAQPAPPEAKPNTTVPRDKANDKSPRQTFTM